jgi:hypothetical protein
MPRRRSNIIRFPGSRPGTGGLILSDAAHDLVASAIGPCHGSEIEDFLAAAPRAPQADDISTPITHSSTMSWPPSAPVHGYMKLDEERDGRARHKPERGSTAESLLAIYRRFEDHLS